MECGPETAPSAVRQNHPGREQLERWMRGELPRPEVAEVVRHLLAGCPACFQVTRRLWDLGNRAPLDGFDGRNGDDRYAEEVG
jgi:hypothetical protein